MRNRLWIGIGNAMRLAGLVAALGTSVAYSADAPPLAGPRGEGTKLARVYLEATESWETQGGLFGNRDGIGGSSRGGARPQRAEAMKTLQALPECAGIGVTIIRDKADYMLLLEHDGGKIFFERDSKVALFDNGGELIHAESRMTVKAALKGACLVIRERAGRLAENTN